MTIPVADVLGSVRRDDKILIGFRQPNGLQVAFEISEANLYSIIAEMIGARREFGTPPATGMSDESALPVSRIDHGSTLGHPDRVFLRLVTLTGGFLGIEVPRDVIQTVAAKLIG